MDGESLNKAVTQQLGISFQAETNRDLRPTQTVSSVALIDGRMQQLDTHWGIKPKWADRTIINAQSETVTTKQTFVKAFAQRRCLVPCTGFYEWQPGLKGKRKLHFTHSQGRPLYMAAIWYPADDTPQIVTLTRAAPPELRAIHHRFPVFLDPDWVTDWLALPPLQAKPMVDQWGTHLVTFEPVPG